MPFLPYVLTFLLRVVVLEFHIRYRTNALSGNQSIREMILVIEEVSIQGLHS